MFTLAIPKGRSTELRWITNVIFRDRFGLQFTIEERDSSDIVLEHLGRKLVLANVFFSSALATGILATAIPESPLNMWKVDEPDLRDKLVRESIPILFGNPGFTINAIEGSGRLELDVLGSAFFALSRYEEIIFSERDMHDRFPAYASIAYKEKFLDRPIIDEYVEILWAVIARIWPETERKRSKFSVSISHDIDSPSYHAFRPWRRVLRGATGDIIKRRQLRKAAHEIRMKFLGRRSIPAGDRYNTFDWIMDTSERLGLTSTFYVLCGRNHPLYDADYDVGHPAIRNLLRRIKQRKHSIGLHPSYNTYRSPEMLIAEAERLRTVCAEEGIEFTELHSRMHYLRWHTPTTINILERAGIAVDSSLAFADHAGFRCGTYHEYQAFDPVGNRALDVRIRPLVAMESSVIDKRYMGLGVSAEAADTLLALKNACRTVGGVFSLLWHNTQLVRDDQRSLYKSVLAG